MSLFLLFIAFAWSSPQCEYKYNHNSSLLEWTAYKFVSRAPVKGHFKDITVNSKPADSVQDFLKTVNFEIDAFSVESGDPARNTNLLEFFFKKALSDGKLKGQVVKVDGDNTKGTLDVKFTINGKVVNQTFNYTVDKKNRLTAKAESDVLSFGWKEALNSLHEVCKELHKGDDGESKTWSDVLLYVTTVLKKECHDSDLAE